MEQLDATKSKLKKRYYVGEVLIIIGILLGLVVITGRWVGAIILPLIGFLLIFIGYSLVYRNNFRWYWWLVTVTLFLCLLFLILIVLFIPFKF